MSQVSGVSILNAILIASPYFRAQKWTPYLNISVMVICVLRNGWLSFTRTTFISIDLQYTCCARQTPFALLFYLASFIYVSLIVIYLVIYAHCNYIYFLTFYRTILRVYRHLLSNCLYSVPTAACILLLHFYILGIPYIYICSPTIYYDYENMEYDVVIS